MTFKPGDEVVCVDENPNPDFRGVVTYPVRGKRYTIRGIYPADQYGPDSVWLEELRNPIGDFIDGTMEPSFGAHRFRPVRKTSISIFTSMLTPTPSKEKTNA